MKMLASALLGFVVFAFPINAQTNPENPKFTLTIKAYHSEVTLGSQFGIAITIRNISDKSLSFRFARHGAMADGDQYDVRENNGKQVARYGEQRTVQHPNGETWHIPAGPVGPSGVGWIRPGESTEEASMISDDYNFDHPGKYTIQVSRKESWSPSPIYSNIITITVLPASSKPPVQQ
ncbi:MAG: hypothetical protein WCA89_14900 [Terracidiphilus sp.]